MFFIKNKCKSVFCFNKIKMKSNSLDMLWQVLSPLWNDVLMNCIAKPVLYWDCGTCWYCMGDLHTFFIFLACTSLVWDIRMRWLLYWENCGYLSSWFCCTKFLFRDCEELHTTFCHQYYMKVSLPICSTTSALWGASEQLCGWSSESEQMPTRVGAGEQAGGLGFPQPSLASATEIEFDHL